MTKVQIKAALQRCVNKVFNKQWEDKSIEKLKDLNEKFGSGTRWCSYSHNLVDIIKGGDKKAISKALHVYEEYFKMQGACEAIEEIARETNNFRF